MILNLKWEEYFSIRVDLLFYDRDIIDTEKQRRLLLTLGDFMADQQQWKKLSELRTEPITNPDYHVNSQIRDMELQGFYFGWGGISYEDNEPIGVLMDQPIQITRDTNPSYFAKLFPFRLIQITTDNRKWVQTEDAESRINRFLFFQLQESFQNDATRFISFLRSLKASSGDLIDNFKDSINLWIESIQKESTITVGDSSTIEYFKNAFKSISDYKYILTELSKTEHGNWFDNAGNFIRSGRGNDNPSAVGTLLVLLIERNYLKEDFKPWTNDKKVDFIKKSFGVSVGSRSRNLKSNPTQLNRLNFIKFVKT